MALDPRASRRPAVRADRSADRLVALAAISIAIAYLVLAMVSTLLPPDVRRGAWLPLHLALAGAATTAIAGVMPFFSAALAAAPPAGPVLRATAVIDVAVGAALVAAGVVFPATGLAVAGGGLFLAGIALVALSALGPLGKGLGPSRGLVTRGYVTALVSVAIGAGLAIVYLAGWPPLVEAWEHTRVAHAWLNLIGFVTLVIATTLLHFFPTVVGARIAPHPSATVAVSGLAIGTALVGLGSIAVIDALASLGAVATFVGAIGLAVYAARTWRRRARWTTDAGWHMFAMGGLISAIAWLQVGVAIAAGRLVAFGPTPTAWSLEAVVGPLVVGWMGLAVVASATHLVPAIGPGSPVAHADQRHVLGRLARSRLVVIDAGVAALALGLPLHVDALVATGMAMAGLGLLATALLLGLAMRRGMTRDPART